MSAAGERIRVAIVGSGNIGTDLAVKLRRSEILEPVAMIGIDPGSDGLRHARRWGMETSADGAPWLLANAERLGIRLVYEATSAAIHAETAPAYAAAGIIAIDLTPAAVGPAVIPTVNLADHLDAPNLNMITCGGQATIPMVAAVSAVSPVPYAEIISTVASRSAGPGTRANIDEFTETTAHGLVTIGGAVAGKAIIILNPAEPPILMRNTVYCALPVGADYLHIFRFVGVTAFLSYSMALWQMSIWYHRSWISTIKSTIDGLIYALLTAGMFGWLWPR